ncbi:DUF5362 family protein (plasmid) [Rossellomorea sp. AcN35-11]|nr:DUF5362 domain-containing protein [Rossellomorea aquimaris]WJV32245.1 DUF5362 family protein [Rossellomorea sp. AcN35-11]
MLTPHSVESLKGIQKWGKFMGYLTIIMGVIHALLGLFAFVVGAIPGIVTIFLGLFILRAAKNAEKLVIGYDEHSMNEMLDNFRKYLKVQGILLIISLVLLVVTMLFYGVIFASFI